jgi:2-hydroxyacyl-CoA lyase 1
VAKAFETAITGRPGPVILELREDVLIGAATGCDSLPPSSPPEAIEINASMLQQVAAVLVAARRPLLIVGADLRWSAPFAELLDLVDSLAVPFITSPFAGGAIADDHSLCMNAIPWVVQSQAEVVLVLGTRLDWNFRYGQLIAADATVIQIAIEEQPFVRHREVQIGAQSDPGVFLRALLRQINPAERARARSHRDDSWIATLREASSATQAKRIAKASIDGDLISPLALAAQIGSALPRDAISIFDSNLVLAACQRMIPARLPVSRLTPGTSGCLGTGIAYAIAAKIAHPQRPVVAVCGDFAFGLGVMELETAVRHGVPIVVIVANNDGNAGSLRQKMHLGNHPERVAMFQRGLRYDKLMETFGGYAEHVEHPGEIGPALERALASARAACINVVIDSDAPVPSD